MTESHYSYYPTSRPKPVETETEYIVLFTAVDLPYGGSMDYSQTELCWLSFKKLSDATEAVLDILLAIKTSNQVHLTSLAKRAHTMMRPEFVSLDTTIYRRVVTKTFDPVASVSLPESK